MSRRDAEVAEKFWWTHALSQKSCAAGNDKFHTWGLVLQICNMDFSVSSASLRLKNE